MTEKEKKAYSQIMKILASRGFKFLNELKLATEFAKLSKQNIKLIIDELSNELCEKGLKADSEPNDYGFEIEEIIDICLKYTKERC